MDGRVCRGWKDQRSGSGVRDGDVMPLPPPRKVLLLCSLLQQNTFRSYASVLVEANVCCKFCPLRST